MSRTDYEDMPRFEKIISTKNKKEFPRYKKTLRGNTQHEYRRRHENKGEYYEGAGFGFVINAPKGISE